MDKRDFVQASRRIQDEYDRKNKRDHFLFVTFTLVTAILILLYAAWDVQAATKFRTARVHPTPSWVTCDTVKQYYQQFGSVAAVKAVGRQYGIVPSPAQERQALACLRQ